MLFAMDDIYCVELRGIDAKRDTAVHLVLSVATNCMWTEYPGGVDCSTLVKNYFYCRQKVQLYI